MTDPLFIARTTRDYLDRYPLETERLAPFVQFLEETPPPNYADRSHSVGHVTTSGFLVSENGEEMLLIYHLKLERFLQPGGHVEQDVSLLASALREIFEEVGLDESQLTLCQSHDLPADIDPHRIPARGDLPAHWHFDFRYLFRVKNGAPIRCQVEEVARPAWFSWDSEAVRQILAPTVISRLRGLIELS